MLGVYHEPLAMYLRCKQQATLKEWVHNMASTWQRELHNVIEHGLSLKTKKATKKKLHLAQIALNRSLKKLRS
jgi:hypothetical protein